MEFNEKYPTEKLIPYARNSRTHNEEQIAQIVASIKEFGLTNPILIGDDDVIIAGHGRLMAAQRLGMTEVPVIRLPHLTETQRRALVIADNKIALNAGWDEEMLYLEMEELSELDFDLNLLGFNPDELNEIQLFGEEKSSGNTDDDEVPEAPEEAVNKGLVDAPDFYENRYAYTRCKWIGPGRGWVDPVKEAQACQIRMNIGLSTLENECASQGLDWEEVLEQRAREKERMKKLFDER